MKRLILILSFAGSLSGFIFAQKTYISDYPDRLFDEGKKMYFDQNYIGCIERMQTYKNTATDKESIKDADYYIISSAFAKNDPDVEKLIFAFLKNYPSSQYENRVNFMAASLKFLQNNYQEAMAWFTKSDMLLLSKEEQEDYSYRFAYCLLQTGDSQQALAFFTALASESKKYGEPAAYYKGYIYYTRENYDKALETFMPLQKSKDFKTVSGFYITQIYFIQKRYDDVIVSGKKLLAGNELTGDKRLETRRIVGESYYNTGDLTQTIQYLNDYVNHSPAPLRSSYYTLGTAYFKQNDYSDAVKYLRLVSTDNDVITQNTYLLLGQSYLNLNDKNNARMAFESASNMTFDKQIQEVAMYNCGLLAHETSYSAFGESVSIFERFLNTFPNSTYADKVNDCLVETYLTTRNYRAALASIKKIKKPTDKILEAEQNILFQLGTQYFADNDFQTASQYFTQSMQIGNYNAETKALNYFWRGESNYRLNRYKNAVTDYETYLSQTTGKDKKTDVVAWYNLGYAYFKQKDYSSALSNFTKYVSAEPNVKKASYADAYNRIGDCYFYSRNLSQAEASYAKAASSPSGNGDYAAFQRAYVLGLQKDYAGKINTLNNMINAYPQSEYLPDAYFEMGRAYVMLNQNNKAIAAFGELENKYPKSSWSRKAGLQKGMLYLAGKELDQAAVIYKKVISNYPGSEEAQIAVQDLKTIYLEKNDIQGYAVYVKSLGGQVKFDVTEQDSLTYLSAERLYMHGDNAKAKAALTGYLQSFPNGAFSVNAHYYLGSMAFVDKKYPDAAVEFGKVVNAPDNKFTEDALARSAEIAYIQKDYNKSLGYFKSLEAKAEQKENLRAAKIGILRCAGLLNKPQEVINAADELLQDKKLSPELADEALFGRAQANLKLNPAKAVEDLQTLSKDTRNVYGAQAKYLLAQYYFDNKQSDKAEKEILDFIQKGTPHSYWLARGFILMADINIAGNDKFQAGQYLQSLRTNYKGTNDDISSLIDDRMKKIGK
ncbi:MAG: tetratricopeptide repeat protein [Candidatus Azobacteroides sp.]|nr:tetratricopeptide repeat protein [Candidatus Azobacteroides sp.]